MGWREAGGSIREGPETMISECQWWKRAGEVDDFAESHKKRIQSKGKGGEGKSNHHQAGRSCNMEEGDLMERISFAGCI